MPLNNKRLIGFYTCMIMYVHTSIECALSRTGVYSQKYDVSVIPIANQVIPTNNIKVQRNKIIYKHVDL